MELRGGEEGRGRGERGGEESREGMERKGGKDSMKGGWRGRRIVKGRERRGRRE